MNLYVLHFSGWGNEKGQRLNQPPDGEGEFSRCRKKNCMTTLEHFNVETLQRAKDIFGAGYSKGSCILASDSVR